MKKLYAMIMLICVASVAHATSLEQAWNNYRHEANAGCTTWQMSGDYEGRFVQCIDFGNATNDDSMIMFFYDAKNTRIKNMGFYAQVSEGMSMNQTFLFCTGGRNPRVKKLRKSIDDLSQYMSRSLQLPWAIPMFGTGIYDLGQEVIAEQGEQSMFTVHSGDLKRTYIITDDSIVSGEFADGSRQWNFVNSIIFDTEHWYPNKTTITSSDNHSMVMERDDMIDPQAPQVSSVSEEAFKKLCTTSRR